MEAVADIFVSHSRQNKARVAPLVRALEAEGWPPATADIHATRVAGENRA
jgi:hypothetical protein